MIVEGGEKGEGRKAGTKRKERGGNKQSFSLIFTHCLYHKASSASHKERQRNTERSTFFPSPIVFSFFTLRSSLCIPLFVLVLLSLYSGHKSQLTLYVFPSLSKCSHQREREREKVKQRESEKTVAVNLQISVLSLWTKPRGWGSRTEKTESRERKCDMGMS